VRHEEVQAAVTALGSGDDGPARELIDDRRLDQLLVRGSGPCEIGQRLADLARRHHATSVGIAYVGDDPTGAVEHVAAAARGFRHALA
jgi:hypothetical protein